MKSEFVFSVGDLVIFKSISPSVMTNQIGVITQVGVKTIYQRNELSQEEWYVAQFGTVTLIVSAEMISKMEPPDG